MKFNNTASLPRNVKYEHPGKRCYKLLSQVKPTLQKKSLQIRK